ncbi:MAG: hypothetical protein OHK93_003041 [Ramalina farinacea]|uniref:DUF7730 domain-containing protein n=1 Tax=Ramalina farinacea TaxID=258253 RepID=A0AA43QSN1_9LECA|nr:hypothetical protein [Ramalina farinacea]
MPSRTKNQSGATETSSGSVEQRGGLSYLSLPPEIRTMVMREHFGSQTIHVLDSQMIHAHPRDGQPLSHMLRTWNISEDQVRQWQKEKPNSWARRHRSRIFPAHGNFVPESVDVGLLRANKQIHMEADHFLYSSQTFAFNEPDTFRRFCNNISPSQKQALRKIDLSTEVHLLMKTTRGSFGLAHEQQWPEDALPALEYVTDLRLKVCIRLHREETFFGPRRDPKDPSIFLSENFVSHTADGAIQLFHKALRWQFGFLRQLKNLKRVTVEIDDNGSEVQPDCLQRITAAFEAEMLFHSTDEIIQAEDVEEGHREEQAKLISAILSNQRNVIHLPRQIQFQMRDVSAKDRQVRLTLRDMEELPAEEQQRREELAKKLREKQEAVAQSTKKVEELQKQLAEVDADKPWLAQEKLREVEEKIAAHSKKTFAYLREFEWDGGN